jgi:polar amino acid transport system substrate-binding protein
MFALFVLILLLLLPNLLCAQSAENSVRVAVRICPPFVINDSGEYSGISIFLWDKIAEKLGFEYSIEEFDRQELLESVVQDKADVVVSCLSITQNSEEIIDFSHSFFETHLSIAVKQHGFMHSIKNVLLNKKMFIAIGIVLGVAILIGGIFFFLEHHINDKLYSMKKQSSRLIEAFIAGLLFITSGPIRYYEFKTLSGRMIAAILAVGSTVMIAGITGILASALTLDQIQSKITGLHDLANVRAGVVKPSPSFDYLTEQGINVRIFKTGEDMVAGLDEGQVDAIVGEDAVIKYHIKEAQAQGKYESLLVLPFVFAKKNYGLALRDENPHLESVNQALLSVCESPAWTKELAKYIGK